jgi:hypothetical protein
VRTKDLCWFVETIYDLKKLPEVSTAGPKIGQGVTHSTFCPSFISVTLMTGGC